MVKAHKIILTFILLLIGLGYSQTRKVETDTLKARAAFKIRLSGTWYDRSSFFGFLNGSNQLGLSGIADNAVNSAKIVDASVANADIVDPWVFITAGNGLYITSSAINLGQSVTMSVNTDDSTIAVINDTLHVIGGAGTLDSSGVRQIINDSLSAYTPFKVSDYANIQATIDAAEAQTGGEVLLKPFKPLTRYAISDSLTIEGKSITIQGQAAHGTKIKSAFGNKSIFRIQGASPINAGFKNIWLAGTGKTNTNHIGIYASVLGAGSDLMLENIRLDSLGVGLRLYDQTNVNLKNAFFRYNKINLGAGYQADGVLIQSSKFYDSDTSIYAGYATTSNSIGPITAIQPVFGRDSLATFLKNETSIYNEIGGYREDNQTEFWSGRNGGSAGTVGNAFTQIGSFAQGTKVEGFEINKIGRYTQIGNIMTTSGLDDSYVIDLNNINASYIGFNNIFTGGNDSIRYYANHGDNANNFIVANTKYRQFISGTPLSSTEAAWSITGHSWADKLLWMLSRRNAGDALTEQYRIYAADISNRPVLGVSQGYIDLGEATSLPTASASYRGFLTNIANAAGDKPYVCLYNGSNYVWAALATSAAADTFIIRRGSDDFKLQNAAGYGDPTVGSYTTGFERTTLDFPNSLTAAQVALNFQHKVGVGTIWVEIYWFADTTAGAVKWGAQYIWDYAGESAGNPASGAFYTTTTTNGTANVYNKTRIAVTISDNISASDEIRIRIRRNGADAEDTMNSPTKNARLQWVMIKYL